ncbi:hypothetical protein [Kaistia sp. MMO-174]|uniref:hypothetical protein n=1 Tax=Kaistia sp. MMO-174 TaxID=3081256 RepID=UPI001ACEC91C|nr:hypothetical protein [Hyphomicrobiales bacterium]
MITEMKSILHIGAIAAILGIGTIGVSAPALARGHHNIEDSGSHGGGGWSSGWSGGHGGSTGPTMASAWSTGGMSGGWSGGGHPGNGWWGGGSGGSWSDGHDHDHNHHHHHPGNPGVPILPLGLLAGYNQQGSSYSNEEYSYDYAPCAYPHHYSYLGYRNVCAIP